MESSADNKITVRCACGKSLKAPASAVGRKAKCPACGNVLTIAAPQPTADDELGGLYELAEQESEAAKHQPQQDAGPRCPSCGGDMPAGAVLCVSCGTDIRTGKKVTAKRAAPAGAAPPAMRGGGGGAASGFPSPNRRQEKPVDAMAPQGSFWIGVATSFGFAMAAGLVWFLVTWLTEYDIFFVALLVGIAAGAGMQLGQKGYSTMGGVAAAGVTFVTLLLARAAVVVAVLLPILRGGGGADPDSEEGQQELLVDQIMTVTMREEGQDFTEFDDEQYEAARSAAERRAEEMSPAEREEIKAKAQDYETRDRLEAHIVGDIMEERKLDYFKAKQAEIEAIEAEAAEQVDAMTPQERTSELARQDAEAEAEFAEAMKEAEAEGPGSEGISEAEGPGAGTMAMGLVAVLLIAFGWKSAIFMLGALFIAYRTAAGSVHG